LVTIGQNNSNEMKKGMIGDNNYIKEKGHPTGGLSLLFEYCILLD
jgi:hypothetical protein